MLTKPKTKRPAKLKKVLTVANIQNQTVTKLQWLGKWLDAFGKPQDRGVWFVWGGSGSGKSTFIMMLAKALALLNFKVFYNLLEEETDDTDYIDRTELLQMNEVEKNFHTQSYNYNELIAYLNMRNPPKVVVVDSITYLTKDWDQYMALKALCNRKNIMLIIVGHAEGKNPRSEFEKSIRYDAKMKVFIEGYLAQCQGRTIGENGGRFIVYQKGYDMLRGES
ncbi:AAA family ATPase [Bizionia argentinensis JUB59]|uniref:AAA family ATPase n=1 Tax=Bizionia argentinensis JUB59 TaxID=1046627 RepID=G2EB68_9FLAO|nr:ATP-binding protein [Bizionia argentinensis]EGV44422.1 AAA family ATPase [Bizionia argentinensis JUB59]